MVDFQRKVYCILGLPFDAISMSETLGHIHLAAKNNERCFISTPNLNFLIASQNDKAFRDSVYESDLSLADGMPIIWISKLLGLPITSRVAGSDLFDKLTESMEFPLKVYFFGGLEGMAELACQKLNLNPKGVKAVGFESPGFGSVEEMSSKETIDKINSSMADFVVVALGARKGQAWIQYNRNRLNAPIISHLGAVVNFMAGSIKRAPNYFQSLGLEWLWRIYQEPNLWTRYYQDGLKLFILTFTRVIPYAFWLLRNKKISYQCSSVTVTTDHFVNHTKFSILGSCLMSTIDPLKIKVKESLQENNVIEFDLAHVDYIDSGFIGFCLLLYGYVSKLDGNLILTNVSDSNRNILKWNCAEFLLE